MVLALRGTTSARWASSCIRCLPGVFQWKGPLFLARSRQPSKQLSDAAWQRIPKIALPAPPISCPRLSRHARHFKSLLLPLSLSQHYYPLPPSCCLNPFSRKMYLERTRQGKPEIGPQVHMLRQVYTITAQPSQTGIDVVTTSIPALEKVETITGSLTGQTADQQCNRFFFIQCQQAADPTSQLRQSLISQLSARMDSQLQALHATQTGSKHFTDLSAPH